MDKLNLDIVLFIKKIKVAKLCLHIIEIMLYYFMSP